MRRNKKNINIGDNCQCFTVQSAYYLLERRRKDLFMGAFTRSAQDSDISVSLKRSEFKRKFRGKDKTLNINLHEHPTLVLSNLYFLFLVALMDEGC